MIDRCAPLTISITMLCLAACSGAEIVYEQNQTHIKYVLQHTPEKIVLAGAVAAYSAGSMGWSAGFGYGSYQWRYNRLYNPGKEIPVLKMAARTAVCTSPAGILLAPFFYEKFYGKSAYKHFQATTGPVYDWLHPWHRNAPERMLTASSAGGIIGATIASGTGIASGLVHGLRAEKPTMAQVARTALKEGIRRTPIGLVNGMVLGFFAAVPRILQHPQQY